MGDHDSVRDGNERMGQDVRWGRRNPNRSGRDWRRKPKASGEVKSIDCVKVVKHYNE